MKGAAVIGLVGIAIIFVMVFGGYLMAGGKLGIILKTLPFEMIMIGGAAIGAFVISNDLPQIKHTLGDVAKVFKGPKWKSTDYRDLLCLLFELIRLNSENPVLLEQHFEDPGNSAIFQKYPKILADKEAIELMCDTLRSASMNYDDPHQVEEVLDKRMEMNRHHAEASIHSLQAIADGLPALGIVAAVLGVIKTMASIDQPPEVLGKMIGGALVGTFLGVFLAYGLIGPFAAKLKSVSEDDLHFYQLIREVLIANLHTHTASLCIEVGRQNIPGSHRPTFNEVETSIKNIRRSET